MCGLHIPLFPFVCCETSTPLTHACAFRIPLPLTFFAQTRDGSIWVNCRDAGVVLVDGDANTIVGRMDTAALVLEPPRPIDILTVLPDDTVMVVQSTDAVATLTTLAPRVCRFAWLTAVYLASGGRATAPRYHTAVVDDEVYAVMDVVAAVDGLLATEGSGVDTGTVSAVAERCYARSSCRLVDVVPAGAGAVVAVRRWLYRHGCVCSTADMGDAEVRPKLFWTMRDGGVGQCTGLYSYPGHCFCMDFGCEF